MAEWLGQVRVFVSDNTELVLISLIVVALFGGFLVYSTHIDPGTELETVEESSWTSNAEFDHQATVLVGTDVFEEGEILQNRETYLESITPQLDGQFEYTYTATDSGSLDVEIAVSLVLRSVGDEGGTVYWREERALGSVSESEVSPGEAVSAPFSVNVTELKQRVDEIESQLGGTPGDTEMLVESQLSLSGERNGLMIDEVDTQEIEIEDGGSVYSIGGSVVETDSGEQRSQETVPASYGPLRSVGGPALLIAAGFGIGLIGAGKWRGSLTVSETEREWLAFQSAKAEFDEWITPGRIPDAVLPDATVTVDTLEGLVDVGIDSNRRVIADQASGDFIVVLEGTAYRYEPPERPESASEPLLPGKRSAPAAIENGSEAEETAELGDESDESAETNADGQKAKREPVEDE